MNARQVKSLSNVYRDSLQLAIDCVRLEAEGLDLCLSYLMQGIFTLALLLLNGWLGNNAEALDAAQASVPRFVGGSVVERNPNCTNCEQAPTLHMLLKHSDGSTGN
ncbi:hypothetical protein PHYBOEH_000692 [Phytophthora boehmeriae]|uniref:Uncharacterized protein n=1 Tax=Phytophthora boehmeriae TaxID=109152 RepID=A0A8T1WTM8_9STRA|nr:hypothetical protein PHYBOEH_000692 [Phytophthora boehmeriae]